ncbi:MAG: aminomethyl transferase family protein [Myxococcales bacterium]|nr:MAG: aminomethyl transferase family protein [Myxococcales bacterium]
MSADGLAAVLSSRAVGTASYRGREVATSYGDVVAEWRALDEATGLVDFSFLTDIVATGDERVEFLQGQLSQDVSDLRDGGGTPALALTVQGRVQAILGLYARGDGIDIVVDATGRDTARQRLEQFLVADDVEFEDGPCRERIGVVGPGCHELLARACGVTVSGQWWWTRTIEIAGVPVSLRGRGDLRVPSVDIAVEDGALKVWRALEELGAEPAGCNALEILRVESGLPLLGVDLDEHRFAVEARLEWAIHFNKGCYVGQEVIERAVSRGRVNRELCLLGAAEPVVVGVRVAGGSERDVVTSAAVSPGLGPVCLAYVPRDAAVEGTELRLESETGVTAVRVLRWPRSRSLAGR